MTAVSTGLTDHQKTVLFDVAGAALVVYLANLWMLVFNSHAFEYGLPEISISFLEPLGVVIYLSLIPVVAPILAGFFAIVGIPVVVLVVYCLYKLFGWTKPAPNLVRYPLLILLWEVFGFLHIPIYGISA